MAENPKPAERPLEALANAVRRVHEAKVKDCKEDIDTLLVFAGLFSAVTSAFLIESYKTLQPDSSDITNHLLAHLVLQQQSPSTTDLPTPDVNLTCIVTSSCSFDPPLFARRVNHLWFVSLILSLATAALAVLVKQWLREFFSGDYTSPKIRLRIHYYRYPGLVKWRVFELVALLSVLLLLSLGLFLIGLCFFTQAVNPAIGLNTFVVVAFVGCLFIVGVFAPIVSPQCPYKVTFLKLPIKAIRWLLAEHFPGLKHHYQKSSEWIGDNTGWSGFSDTASAEEESFARKEELATDLKILSELDKWQLDDQLFLDTMVPLIGRKDWKSSGELIEHAEDILDTIIKFVQHRMPVPIKLPLQKAPDLGASTITKETWIEIVGVISSLLREVFPSQLPPPDPTLTKYVTSVTWSKNALVLLLSPAYHLPNEGAEALARALQACPSRTASFICSQVSLQGDSAAEKFSQLMLGELHFQRVLSCLTGTALREAMLELVRNIFQNPQIEITRAFPLTSTHSSDDSGSKIVLDLLINDVNRTFSTPSIEPLPWIAKTLSIIFALKGRWSPQNEMIVQSWVQRSPCFDWCLLLALSPKDDNDDALAELIGGAPLDVLGYHTDGPNYLDLYRLFVARLKQVQSSQDLKKSAVWRALDQPLSTKLNNFMAAHWGSLKYTLAHNCNDLFKASDDAITVGHLHVSALLKSKLESVSSMKAPTVAGTF